MLSIFSTTKDDSKKSVDIFLQFLKPDVSICCLYRL